MDYQIRIMIISLISSLILYITTKNLPISIGVLILFLLHLWYDHHYTSKSQDVINNENLYCDNCGTTLHR
ncbi:MAG: hypothetical protein OEZ01_09730, partial [Candidatus Heimdallarchaeota archaeon]|nr:hypothetical protein [Candidatus Heimdallarchaeota archaeon]